MWNLPKLLTGAAVTLSLASLDAPATATPPEMTPQEQIALGRGLVLRNCGMCHSVGATGVSADPKAPPFRHLNQRMSVDDLGEGLATGILTGHPAMPQFRFEPYEVVSIVRYLRSVQARPRV